MHKITMRLLPSIAVMDFRATEYAISFSCGMGVLQSMLMRSSASTMELLFNISIIIKSNIIPLNDYVGHHRIYVNEDYLLYQRLV